MRQPHIALSPPRFINDPEASKQMAIAFAQIEDILRDLYAKAGTVEVRTSAPAVGELNIEGDGRGNIRSDAIILDNATQTNRKIYYKEVGGTLRLIESD